MNSFKEYLKNNQLTEGYGDASEDESIETMFPAKGKKSPKLAELQKSGKKLTDGKERADNNRTLDYEIYELKGQKYISLELYRNGKMVDKGVAPISNFEYNLSYLDWGKPLKKLLKKTGLF